MAKILSFLGPIFAWVKKISIAVLIIWSLSALASARLFDFAVFVVSAGVHFFEFDADKKLIFKGWQFWKF